MKCEFGYCTICEKEIAKTCPTCAHKSPNDQYTEVQIEWTNGSKMRIAVCIDCSKHHAWTTKEAKDGITRAHWRKWDQTGGHYDKAVTVA